MADTSTIRKFLNLFRLGGDRASGMHSDLPISQQPDGTYREAWGVSNGTTEEKGAGLYNMAGQSKCGSIPKGSFERGDHLLEEKNRRILFSYDPAAEKSEIGYIDLNTCEYKKILNDDDVKGCKLDFGMDEWIPILSKVMRNGTCNETHIYWTRKNTLYTLNIDRPCIPVECDELKLFNCKCLVTPTAYPSDKGGNDLEAGARQYFVQLEDEDGNKTNFFNISNPIYIGSKNNRAGEISEQAVHITIESLHQDYPKINLGCIKTIGGVKTAEVIAQLGYSEKGVSFFHRSKSQHLYDLTIEEVLTKKPGYIRAQDIFQHDRRLHILNVIGERNLDMQKRIIDSVKAKYKVGRVPMRYAHMFRGLQHDGIYSFCVWYNYCDGTHSRAFHIPGTGIDPQSGEGCNDCPDKNKINTATSVSADMNGKPYGNMITKGDDTYVPFTPTDQGLLTADDFELPDDDQFLPAAEGGEGDECACWAFGAALAAGGGRQAFAAMYHVFLEMCRAGCFEEGENVGGDGEDGADIAFRSSSSSSSSALSNDANAGCNCFDATDLPNIESIYKGELGINANTEMTEADYAAWWAYKSGMTYSSDEPCPDCPDPGPPPTPENPTEGQKDDRFKTKDDFAWDNNPEKPTTDAINNSVSSTHDNAYKEKTMHSGSASTSPQSERKPVKIDDCEPEIIYADGDCCIIKEIIPCIDSEGEFSIYESCELYPDEEPCCTKEKNFGPLAGKNIRHHRAPSIAHQPHFISYHDGVPTSEDRGNHEYNNSFARFIWPEFTGIPIPSDDELDKPLCQTNPFTIGWQLRDENSESVIASGPLFGTFEGETLGEKMLFPNLGANSDVKVDRWVLNPNGNHVGAPSTIPAYTFYSPDTSFDNPSLNADYMHNCLKVEGTGWRHHLYAEGMEPESNYVGRCNRKGASQSINLNKWTIQPNDIQCVKSADYVSADRVLPKSNDFTRSLVNLNRESTVFIEIEGSPKIQMADQSFGLDTHTHQKPLTGLLHYVSLNRFVPNAYGSVANAVYHPLWQGKGTDIKDGKATVFVRDGDTFINYWSFKRQSYVSDHVPQDIVPPYEFGGGIVLPFPIRGILKAIFKSISPNCQCGTVPESGRDNDPRNRKSRIGGDDWFPQVQTTLISIPVESRVNLGFQGSGDTAATSTYRDLNGQAFDSSFEGGQYENAWMDRFYATMCENAKWKCTIRVIANFIFTYVIGLYIFFEGFFTFSDGLTDLQVGLSNSILAVVAIGIGIILMLGGIIWIIAWANTDLDNRMIDNLIGIKDCFPDKRPRSNGDGHSRMNDNRVQGFEDNHYEYNYDYSETNRIEIVLGLPNPYDPCHCPNETTYEILFSNPQDPLSERDAYKNFEANSYFLIPSDRGKLKNMFALANGVFVQTTDTMFQIRAGNVELQTNGSNVYLESTGQMLQHPVQILGAGIPEGKGGTTDPNACEVTKWGYLNIDVKAREIALFTGSDYLILGNFGKTKFFDQFMEFEALKTDPKVIRDEKTPGGVGYSIGVDNARSLIFITKKDRSGTKDRSWTITYDVENRCWLGYEFFTPLLYTWDRFNIYSHNEGVMWMHNQPGLFSTVYGKVVPMIVDFVIRDVKEMNFFKWHHSTVDAEFSEWTDFGFKDKDDIFFTEIGFINSFQSSGLLPVISQNDKNTTEKSEEDSSQLPISNIHRMRRFSNLVDKTHSTGIPLFTSQRQDFKTDFNKAALGETKSDKRIIDNWMMVRFVYAGDSKIRVFLKRVITEINHEAL